MFAFLFIGYTAFLSLFKKKNWDSAQYQYQANVIQAEKYLYADTTPESLLIGTSLSARIKVKDLPGFYSLSMPGMGVYDAYHVVFKRKNLPKNIFIEINLFSKPENETFVQTFESPITSFFKQNLEILREQNQPLCIVKDIMKSNKNTPSTQESSPAISPKVFQELLTNLKRDYAHVDSISIKASIIELKKIVQQAQVRGSKVYFLEMPINSDLEYTPFVKFTREIIANNFSNNILIPIPKNKFITTDGMHMSPAEADDYTNYLKSYLQKLHLL